MSLVYRSSRLALPGGQAGAVRRFAALIAVSFLMAYQAIAQNAPTLSSSDSPAAAFTVSAVAAACPTLDRNRARQIADAAFRAAHFRLAGSCYLLAGDAPRANVAFLKAAGVERVATKRALARNAAQVKAQVAQWRGTFRGVWK